MPIITGVYVVVVEVMGGVDAKFNLEQSQIGSVTKIEKVRRRGVLILVIRNN